MPWKECCQVDLRREAVAMVRGREANLAEVARRFGVSRKTLYKWLGRWEEAGEAGLRDQSRRPRSSPTRTSERLEEAVVKLRRENPAWGGRKISQNLRRRGLKGVPAPSTVTGILRRHGLIEAPSSEHPGPWARFERPAPNDLWQMDFKGHFGLEDGTRCHPLTILDDCSRYSVAIRALPKEQGKLVQRELVRVFEVYGLPRQILTDNGSPWGDDSESRDTKLTVWLIDHGVSVIHGRPRHPQTQGKGERFHRTLKAEVLRGRWYRNLEAAQAAFDRWRPVYNYERPHDALQLEVPGSRYQLSPRPFDPEVPEWEYAPGTHVRSVDCNGRLSYRGVSWKIGRPFVGKRVGIRPTTAPEVYEVYYRHQWVADLDLETP